MRVLVTGQSGFVGKHVVKALKQRDCIVLDRLDQEPDAIIHLAWAGLPNYEDQLQYENVGWQFDFLKQAVAKGIINITIAGTCLETLEMLIPYSIAKLALRALAFELLPTIKWARLWYPYGEERGLLSKLLKAEPESEFPIVDGERDFMEVGVAANHICNIAMQNHVVGIVDVCTGVAVPILSFCQQHAPTLRYKPYYPRPFYEPFSFHGDPRRLKLVEHAF